MIKPILIKPSLEEVKTFARQLFDDVIPDWSSTPWVDVDDANRQIALWRTVMTKFDASKWLASYCPTRAGWEYDLTKCIDDQVDALALAH